eukprot:TRINITY_DN41197_c0_g1_i1.p1 TRINITY_DN41197_c0_g1~~TRINITY_DN41197_c0_g1_i1.p1  ORF type:complete len:327 (-),score=72.74 TRINITY_DN41197_c0_g1_i1:15-995(-)
MALSDTVWIVILAVIGFVLIVVTVFVLVKIIQYRKSRARTPQAKKLQGVVLGVGGEADDGIPSESPEKTPRPMSASVFVDTRDLEEAQQTTQQTLPWQPEEPKRREKERKEKKKRRHTKGQRSQSKPPNEEEGDDQWEEDADDGGSPAYRGEIAPEQMEHYPGPYYGYYPPENPAENNSQFTTNEQLPGTASTTSTTPSLLETYKAEYAHREERRKELRDLAAKRRREEKLRQQWQQQQSAAHAAFMLEHYEYLQQLDQSHQTPPPRIPHADVAYMQVLADNEALRQRAELKQQQIQEKEDMLREEEFYERLAHLQQNPVPSSAVY